MSAELENNVKDKVSPSKSSNGCANGKIIFNFKQWFKKLIIKCAGIS
jgi:hypothetical protein